jgi:Domain of unknown function (DUF4281)
MELETIFSLMNGLALCGWVLLLVAPAWRFTRPITLGAPGVLVFGGVYTFLIGANISSEGGFGSLAEVALLFQNPALLLAGWIHYLAFDLFVGSWESANAARYGINRWIMIPCLILTFMFGPAGLLLYFLVRYAMRRVWFESDPFG